MDTTKIKNEMARIGKLLSDQVRANNAVDNFQLYELKGRFDGLIFALNSLNEVEGFIEDDSTAPNNEHGNYLEDRNDR